MKKGKSILLSLWIILLLSILLIACGDEQHTCAPIDTAPPTQPPATVSNNNIENTQATVPAKETNSPTVDQTTAPMADETTAPTEKATVPTEPEETQAHEHAYSVVDTVAPSCTEDGHKTYECPCGETYTETIVARGYHVWGEWQIFQEATTFREGERIRKCVDCGDSQHESIDKLPPEETPSHTEPPATEPPHVHDYSERVIDPTTESQGYTEYTCSGCGHTYRDNYTDMLPQPTEPSINEDTGCDLCNTECIITVILPTPDSEGYTLYECPNCGYSVRKHPTSYGHTHNYTVLEIWEPTCLDIGYTFYECDCGDTCIADTKDALGHDFSTSNICSRCGYTEESTITLDYEAAMAYGNQYAVDTYGWLVDLNLNFDNAGFNFPHTASPDTVIAKGGQAYLHRMVEREIDHLYTTLIDRGGTGKAYVNCHVYEDNDGTIFIYVYYG